MATPKDPTPSPVRLTPLPPFTPDLYERAWASVPHPTLPLLATAHAKSATVFSLSTLSKHSALSGGHARSVRCAAWKPGLPPHRLCLVTGSFDSTAGLWRWDGDVPFDGGGGDKDGLEVEITAGQGRKRAKGGEDDDSDGGGDDDDWEFTLVLEGHENEIKGAAFSPSGQFLATCSRDKSVWIWEDVGASETDDEWETVAVLGEHDGDVKAVAWCPDVPGRARGGGAAARSRCGPDVLASASYDNTARIWREDGDGEWVCVAVLEGHEGTVWGLQWEPAASTGGRFPRLLTYSADATIRVWTLRQEEEEGDEQGQQQQNARSAFGGIPNTMRRSLKEDWDCTAILPRAHTRDVYSAAWSASSGLVASTGSDGIIAIYGEVGKAALGRDGEDVSMTGVDPPQKQPPAESTAAADGQSNSPDAGSRADGVGSTSDGWRVLGTLSCGHGPYEINHITWCKRFDAGAKQRGVDEMLVTTGDDGIVRPWQVEQDEAGVL